jgi:hypothetical protein
MLFIPLRYPSREPRYYIVNYYVVVNNYCMLCREPARREMSGISAFYGGGALYILLQYVYESNIKSAPAVLPAIIVLLFYTFSHSKRPQSGRK